MGGRKLSIAAVKKIFYNQPTWLYPALALILLGMFLPIKEPNGDDIYFSEQGIHNVKALTDFLSMRYNSWSSRLFTETITVILLNLDMMVWRIFCVVNIMIIALSIKYLTGIGSSLWKNLFLCMLVAAFPFSYYMSAGWITTTTLYLMSAALGLVALCPVRKLVAGKRIVSWEAVLYVLSTVVACIHEQVCAIVLGVCLCSCIYCIASGKRLLKTQICQLVVCILDMLYIFTCPGNAARTAAETATWLPEFAEWSLPEKVLRGIIHSTDYFFYNNSLDVFCLMVIFLLTLLMLSAKAQKHKKAIALGGALWLYAVQGIIILPETGKQIGLLQNGLLHRGEHGENLLSGGIDIALAASAVFLTVLLFLELYWLLGKSISFLTGAMTLAAGFGSVAIVGLSPTLYASRNRLFYFLMYAVIILMCCVVNKLCPDRAGKREKAILSAAGILLLFSSAKYVLLLVKVYSGVYS